MPVLAVQVVDLSEGSVKADVVVTYDPKAINGTQMQNELSNKDTYNDPNFSSLNIDKSSLPKAIGTEVYLILLEILLYIVLKWNIFFRITRHFATQSKMAAVMSEGSIVIMKINKQ